MATESLKRQLKIQYLERRILIYEQEIKRLRDEDASEKRANFVSIESRRDSTGLHR